MAEIGIYAGIIGMLASWAFGIVWRRKLRQDYPSHPLYRSKLMIAAVIAFIAFWSLAGVSRLVLGHPL